VPVTEAAALVGVSRRTASRRLLDPGFRARVQELRGGLIANAAGRLAAAMTQASDTLLALLGDGDGKLRLGAARAVLEHGVRLRELADLTTRIDDLEHRLAERSPAAVKP
jgi:hypothetical protein